MTQMWKVEINYAKISLPCTTIFEIEIYFTNRARRARRFWRLTPYFSFYSKFDFILKSQSPKFTYWCCYYVLFRNYYFYFSFAMMFLRAEFRAQPLPWWSPVWSRSSSSRPRSTTWRESCPTTSWTPSGRRSSDFPASTPRPSRLKAKFKINSKKSFSFEKASTYRNQKWHNRLKTFTYCNWKWQM